MRIFQRSDEALVRQPGFRRYSDPVPVHDVAKDTWELAILSDRVYQRDWGNEEISTRHLPELGEWVRCNDFMSAGFRAAAQGLYVEVWRREAKTDQAEVMTDTVAVVFKGTNFFSLRDWKSNFRWVLRFVPWYQDQYTLLCKDFGREFVPWVAKTCQSNTRLVAAGHSLGGGLAQQFAYALPPTQTRDGCDLRVSYVCAFDPSPVTGWSSVDSTTRTRNANGLRTDRLFEHGEILAYLRLALSYVLPPSAANPEIKEIRVNFDPRLWLVMSHMMETLSDGLARAMDKMVQRAQR